MEEYAGIPEAANHEVLPETAEILISVFENSEPGDKPHGVGRRYRPEVPYSQYTLAEKFFAQRPPPKYRPDNYVHTVTSKATTKKTRIKISMVEICTSTMQMTIQAIKRGWKGENPITIETGYDLLTPQGRNSAWQRLLKLKPDVLKQFF